jgi:hypothetical protein
MIKREKQRIQVMAKRKSSNQKFMKYAGSIQGPADLSSRRGFSRVVEEKAEVKPSKKPLRKETRQAVSLR